MSYSVSQMTWASVFSNNCNTQLPCDYDDDNNNSNNNNCNSSDQRMTTTMVNGSEVTASLDHDTILHTHEFWNRFHEQIRSVPDFVYFGFGTYITIICLVGTIGNATVIGIFCRSVSLRTPSNLFVINLAISDLTFTVVNGFPLMTIACFKKKWPWGDYACQWYAYVSGITGLASINTLAWISVERYLVIVKPFRMLRISSNGRYVRQIFVVWAWALLWSTPPMLGWGSYIPEGLQVSCTFDYLTRTPANIAFNYCLFGLGFCVPVVVIVCAYVGIVRDVRRQSKELQVACRQLGAQRSALRDSREDKQNLQLAKVAAGTITMFVISWLPYAIIAQLAIAGYQQFITPYTTELPVMFAKASAIWNPIIYALSHPRYKSELRRLCPLRGRKKRRSSRHSSTFADLRLASVDQSDPEPRSTMYTIIQLKKF